MSTSEPLTTTEPDFATSAEAIAAARARLSDVAWDRLVGAAESESTALRNRLALDCIALRPRVLVGVADVDPSTTVLGQRVRIPVLLANIGDPEALSPAGYEAVMEVASGAGSIPFVARRAEARPGARAGSHVVTSGSPRPILELPAHDPDTLSSDLVERAADRGYAALCLSLVPHRAGRREREPCEPRPLPRRLRDVWRVVAEVRGRTTLPLVVKGVMGGEDARMAIDQGCAGIYVSNLGGRALDHAEGTIDVLPEVVAAVNGRAEVIVDGGFTRGTDMVKALACGARAVAIGRLQGFGLAAGGAAGLGRILEILEDELRIAMSLLGAQTVGDLGPGNLAHDALPVQLPGEPGAPARNAAGPGRPTA